MDFDAIITAMGQYNESLIKAGVLLAAEGLAMEEGFIVDSTPILRWSRTARTERRRSCSRASGSSRPRPRTRPFGVGEALPVGAGFEARSATGIGRSRNSTQNNEYVQKEAGWREEFGTDRPVTA